MSQITLQGKQQALMRVAASRVSVLDSVTATQQHASRCVQALPVSPALLLRIGAVAGAAATVAGTLAGLRKRSKAAEKAAASKPRTIGMLCQLLLPSLLPLLQRYLQNKVAAQSGTGRTSSF